jgi:hypothetical protein
MAARVLVTSRDGEVAPVIADVVGFPNGAVDARVEIRDGRLGINVEHHGHGEGNDREGLLLVSFADGETRRIPWMIMSPERK